MTTLIGHRHPRRRWRRYRQGDRHPRDVARRCALWGLFWGLLAAAAGGGLVVQASSAGAGGGAASGQGPAAATSSAVAGAAAGLFRSKCTGCHTFGKGIRVGPDLKHVTDRHTRGWLIAWIKSSTAVIASGDPGAVALFTAFKQQRMPDHDLSDAQIGGLLDFLAADGPELEEQHRIREANSASAADIAWGRRLFYGESRLQSGDLACVACHSVSQTALGGRLAADLTNAFSRYRDKGLDQVLRQACLPRVPALEMERVEDRESLALRAFLRVTGAGGGAIGNAGVGNAGVGSVGSGSAGSGSAGQPSAGVGR